MLLRASISQGHILRPLVARQITMKQRPLRIGIVGFSRPQFDQQAARTILERELAALRVRHPQREIEIVSGYTNAGVPQIAYEIADQLELTTVGFSARQALRVRSGLYPVDQVILEGERFSDESEAFVRYIDGLIRVGGGRQSREEVRLFKACHPHKPLARILQEYEVEWYGKES